MKGGKNKMVESVSTMQTNGHVRQTLREHIKWPGSARANAEIAASDVARSAETMSERANETIQSVREQASALAQTVVEQAVSRAMQGADRAKEAAHETRSRG